MQTDNFKRYAPYCSYHCQGWANLEGAQRYINENFGPNAALTGERKEEPRAPLTNRVPLKGLVGR